MSFRQLEENINKWTLELEDLEKVFLNQATQVNAWDQLLIKNGEKIISLHESVAAVKLDQQRLDHELDFVSAQQAELEEMLKPLEASLASTGPVDSERERIYAVSVKEAKDRLGNVVKRSKRHYRSHNFNICQDARAYVKFGFHPPSDNITISTI